MVILGRTAVLAFLAMTVAQAAAQSTFPVTSLVDGSGGALRAALTAAAQSPGAAVVIDLRVSGNYRLDPARGGLPPLPAGKQVTLRATGFGAGQRFTIDATAIGAPVTGLAVQGAGARITAPLTVLVNLGAGVRVYANDARFADLEITGGSSWCFRAENVRDLVVDRLVASGSVVGISLWSCSNSRLGSAASGGSAQAFRCTGQGILLQQCTDVTLERFAADDNRGPTPVPGILVQDGLRVVLGSAAHRSSASRNGAEGVKLERCTGSRVTSADLLDNAYSGFRIDGGSGNSLSDALVDNSGRAGIQIGSGAAGTTLGPGVSVGWPATGSGPCVVLSNCTSTRLDSVECHHGSPGVLVGQGSVDVVLDGCHLHDCHRGVMGNGARDLRIRGSRIERNTMRGVELDRTVGATVSGCRLLGNFGPGIEAVNGSHGTTVGPGNEVRGNGLLGIGMRDSDDCLVFDNPAVNANNGVGIELHRSQRTVIRGNILEGNLGSGMRLVFSSNAAVVGPGNEVRGTLGSGVRVELCDGVLLTGNRIVGNQGFGIGFIDQASSANPGHVVRSTLIADNRDLGVMMRDGNRVRIEASTISGNYRGLQASSGSGSPASIHVDSSILWGNVLDDYDNSTMPSGVVTAEHCTVQRPAGTGTNDSRDPRFVDPSRGDYRLSEGSPAIGAAHQARYTGLAAVARDAGGGDRKVDCDMDRGALELQRIAVAPRSGSRVVDVTLQWPAASANRISLLLLSASPPGPGIVPCSTFTPDPFTTRQIGVFLGDPGVLAPVPQSGVVRATVNLQLPPGGGPWELWAAGFAFAESGGAFSLVSTTGTAGFRIP